MSSSRDLVVVSFGLGGDIYSVRSEHIESITPDVDPYIGPCFSVTYTGGSVVTYAFDGISWIEYQPEDQ